VSAAHTHYSGTACTACRPPPPPISGRLQYVMPRTLCAGMYSFAPSAAAGARAHAQRHGAAHARQRPRQRLARSPAGKSTCRTTVSAQWLAQCWPAHLPVLFCHACGSRPKAAVTAALRDAWTRHTINGCSWRLVLCSHLAPVQIPPALARAGEGLLPPPLLTPSPLRARPRAAPPPLSPSASCCHHPCCSTAAVACRRRRCSPAAMAVGPRSRAPTPGTAPRRGPAGWPCCSSR
jgi:hypothetical protein